MNVFLPADILIPDVESMEKWSVIACDQFSSQPEYWKDVKETVGDAPVELTHVLLLCDDRSDGLMKWMSGKKEEMRKIYNFNLMKEGGHISGWLVSGKLAKDFEKQITSYENISAEMPYAVGDGNHSLATAKVCYENYKKTHSQTLLPMLDEVAKMIELDLNTIDVIAVSAGPGSFTGLRIGSATAKGLALALNKQIVSVPTVDALAYNLWGCEDQVCPLMDARRQQAYTGLYTFSDGQMQTLLPQCAVGIDEITAKINESGKKTVFLGDGVPVFADYLKENLQVPYLFAPAHCNKQRAACVAVLGGILYRQGKAEDAAAHKPDYLRLSQAERERQEKARDFRI